ncbi:MAG: DUF6090 family protein [Robiginitalea sp.]|jgi:hypothetical protein
MFRFFRNIRQRLITGSKFSRYLLYAVGEILLVVIGILIALQVDNWNETRKSREQGAEFRAQLRESVVTDMVRIRKRMEFFEKAIEYGYDVEKELTDPQAGDTEARWQFIANVFHASQIWNFNQVTATYNEIQNPDMLGFIGPAELLNALQRYYNEWPLQLSVLTGGTQAYRDFSRSVIPMVMQEFMWANCYDIDVLDVQSFQSCNAPPVNRELIEGVYHDIIADPSFPRLLTRRLSTLYARNVVYKNILAEAEALLTLLDID